MVTMMSEEAVRSFIAIDVTSQEIKNKITQVQDDLGTSGSILKKVEADKLHLTIWFLGEIPKSILDHVTDAMKNLSFQAFSLKFRGLGYFPGRGRINVIWVGVIDPSGVITQIFSQLKKLLSPIGFHPEREDFSPHLTILRVKSIGEKNTLIRQVESYRDFEFGEQSVENVCLKKSVLLPSGPVYSNLLEVKGEAV